MKAGELIPEDSQESRFIEISDSIKNFKLDYINALEYHKGSSWWGVSVAFRCMQVASKLLSKKKLWSRDNLHITTGHSGQGVLDALDHVTHCIRNDRLVFDEQLKSTTGCSKDMRFLWTFKQDNTRQNKTILTIRLVDGFVPDSLYEIVDRRNQGDPLADDPEKFIALKKELSLKIWAKKLIEVFHWTLNEGNQEEVQVPNA